MPIGKFRWPKNACAFIAAMKAVGYRLIHSIDPDHYFARAALADVDPDNRPWSAMAAREAKAFQEADFP